MIVIKHDNKSKLLDEIRKAKSIDEVHEIATEKGLIASHTFDMKWIALAETPNGEDIFIAIEVDSVEYKGKEYPVRTFDVIIPDVGEQTIIVSVQSLSDAMGEKKEIEGTKANDIDCQIYFYMDDDAIGLDAVDICKQHLDTELTLIEEVFE